MSEKRSDLYLSEEGLRFHALRKVRGRNARLKKVRDAKDPLAIFLVEERILNLRMGSKEHADHVQINYKAQSNVEDARSFPQHETYSRIYRKWAQCDEISEQTLEKLLDLLIRRDYARRSNPLKEGEELEPCVLDLYNRWSFQVGLERFEQACKKANDGSPLTYGTLWQRRATKTLAEFSEVDSLCKQLDMDEEQARDVWTAERWKQLAARGLPEPYIDFLIRLERDRGVRLVTSSLQQIEATNDIQKCIARTEFVRFNTISRVIDTLYPPDEIEALKQRWEEYQQDDGETFGEAFERIRDQRGLTNRQLSVALDIQPPEMRGKKTNGRIETYRPSGQIRFVCDQPQFSSQAPAGVLVELVAPTTLNKSENDPAANEQLRSLFYRARELVYTSKGGEMDDLEMRILREYWGLSPEELVQHADGLTARQIPQAERGRLEIGVKTRKKLMQAILMLGQMRAEQARERLYEAEAEKTAIPTSLDDFSSCLAKRLGGYAALRRAIVEYSGEEMREGISVGTLQSIGTGKQSLVPALCTLEKIANAAGIQLPESIKRQWYLQFPDYLSRRKAVPITDPLSRGFETSVAQFVPTLSKFQRTRMIDLSPASIVRNFVDLRKGDYPNWSSLGRYLGACDIDLKAPLFVYLRSLHENGGNVKKALDEWREVARKRKINPDLYEYTFGLTEKERKKYGVQE